MARQIKQDEREEIARDLRKLFRPGSTVYTVLRHVSRSGMMRTIGVVKFAQCEDRGLTLHPNHSIAKLCGFPLDQHRDGMRVGGCGMDMGWAVVFALSARLYPKGFGCIGKNCPSNDHSNGDRDYTRHTKARPHWHTSGDYALRREWL